MTLKAGSCDVQKVYVGACEIKRIYVGSCVIYDATPIVTLAFWGITPDPSTYVMLDVREGTPPIEDARVADLELPDHEDVYQTFGEELGIEAGRVTGDVGSRVVYANDGVDPLDENPWLVHAPEETNVVLSSRNLSLHWEGRDGVLRDFTQVGINGVSSTATDVTDENDLKSAYVRVSYPEYNAEGFSACRWWVKKKDEQPNYLAQLVGGYGFGIPYHSILFNSYDGSWSYRSNTEQGFPVYIDSIGDWWRVTLGNDDPTKIIYSNLFVPAYAGLDGENDVALHGSQICGQAELLIGITADKARDLPPIYTSGAEVTRDSSDITIPIVNHSDEGDYYEFDVIVTGPCNVLDIFLQFDGTDFVLTDGTNEQRLPGTIGTAHTIRIDYSKELLTMTLSVDGVPHAEGPYTGTLCRDTLKVFKDSPYVGKIREVKREGAAGSDAFITTWRTTTDNESATLPLREGYDYNMLVDWGDGQQDTITAWDQAEKTHEWATAGDHDVAITGQCDTFYFNNTGDKDKIIEIKQFGAVKFTELYGGFRGCAAYVGPNVILDCADVSGSLHQCFDNMHTPHHQPRLVQTAGLSNLDGAFSFSDLLSIQSDLDIRGASTIISLFGYADIPYAVNLSGWVKPALPVVANNLFNSANCSSIVFGSGWKFSDFSHSLRNNNQLVTADVTGVDISSSTDLSWWCNYCTSLTDIVGLATLDTSNIETLQYTFRECRLLDPDISAWNIGQVINADLLLSGSAFSQPNYDKLLLSWSQQAFQPNVTAHFGTATYKEEEAKQILLDAGWIITDGGYAVPLWAFTPDPDTAVMQDLRFGTPPVTDARTMDLNAQDQSGVYNAFGLELPYELGEVTGELNSRVVTAVEGEAPIQLYDSFDNDNGTALTDHTPDIDVNGQGWVVLNGSMVLVGDACNTEAANSHASIDIGIMDVDIEEQVFIYDEWAGFSLRVQDHDNCIVAYLHVDGIMEIGEFVGGVYATLNSSSGHTVGYQQTHDVRVTQVGDDIALYFDGAELSATTTRFPGVTSIGLRSGLATAQLGGAKWLDVTVHAEAEIEVPWLVHAPEATNILPYSNDHVDSFWSTGGTGTITKNQVGLNGQSNTAVLVSDTGSTDSYAVISSATQRPGLDDNGQWCGFNFWIKADETATVFPRVDFYVRNSISYTLANFSVYLNQATGELEGYATTTPTDVFEADVVRDGDWWKVSFAAVKKSGAGYVQCAYLPATTQDLEAGDPSFLGSIIATEFDIYDNTTLDILKELPPLTTGTAAATRDSSEITIPSINHSDAGDRYTFDVIVTGGPCNVLATFLQYDGTDFILTDGINECRVTAAIGQHSIQIDYSASDGTMSLTVDGGTAVAGVYDGVLLVGDFDLFRDSPYVGKLRNIKRKGPEGA